MRDRPQLARRQRGRILQPSVGSIASVPVMASRRVTTDRHLQLLAILLALPMFAECFQYMVDVPPLYFLSKAWPMLMLPLCIWAITSLDIPYKLLYITTLFWVLGVTPYVGIIQLGNDTFSALATTVKVWALSSVFSAAGMLVLLRVPVSTLGRVLLGLGIGTYVLMALLWITVPVRAYGGGDAVSKLFMLDPERGYRIYMPMFFGTLLIFYTNRSFWQRKAWWKVVVIAVAFVLQLTIYKQRAAIAGDGVTVVIGAILSARGRRMVMLSLLGIVAAAIALYAVEHAQQSAYLHQSLGGSLTTREASVATAWDYLRADPLRWLIGVGATTRFGDVTLGHLFGTRSFFLTDIGWLGVMFEYGAIGAVLMLLMHLAGLRAAARWSRPDDCLSQACVDYIIYLVLISMVYSVVFTPGELTTIMAISYYLNRERGSYRAGSSHPERWSPRHSADVSDRPSGRFTLPGPFGVANKG
jgi:hypothetical protein